MAFEKVLREDELWTGEMRGVSVHGRRVLLVRTDEGVFAYEDRCAHLGVPLSLGKLERGVITCSAHHYQYEACSGQGVNPERVRLCPFKVRVHAGDITVDVDAPKADPARAERT
jgi:toluene monooxygenase system ferredoxin subunit